MKGVGGRAIFSEVMHFLHGKGGSYALFTRQKIKLCSFYQAKSCAIGGTLFFVWGVTAGDSHFMGVTVNTDNYLPY